MSGARRPICPASQESPGAIGAAEAPLEQPILRCLLVRKLFFFLHRCFELRCFPLDPKEADMCMRTALARSHVARGQDLGRRVQSRQQVLRLRAWVGAAQPCRALPVTTSSHCDTLGTLPREHVQARPSAGCWCVTAVVSKRWSRVATYLSQFGRTSCGGPRSLGAWS